MERPLTLQEAAELYGLKVPTLRAEASRGRLVTFKIGRRDYTLASDMEEMIRLCRESSRRASIWTEGRGESETDKPEYALAALRATIEARKKSSRSISPENTNRPQAQTR